MNFVAVPFFGSAAAAAITLLPILDAVLPLPLPQTSFFFCCDFWKEL